MRYVRLAGAYIGSGGRAIVGTHGAVEFPHAPPVRSSCRRGGERGGTRAAPRVRAVNNRRRGRTPRRLAPVIAGVVDGFYVSCY